MTGKLGGIPLHIIQQRCNRFFPHVGELHVVFTNHVGLAGTLENDARVASVPRCRCNPEKELFKGGIISAAGNDDRFARISGEIKGPHGGPLIGYLPDLVRYAQHLQRPDKSVRALTINGLPPGVQGRQEELTCAEVV